MSSVIALLYLKLLSLTTPEPGSRSRHPRCFGASNPSLALNASVISRVVVNAACSSDYDMPQVGFGYSLFISPLSTNPYNNTTHTTMTTSLLVARCSPHSVLPTSHLSPRMGSLSSLVPCVPGLADQVITRLIDWGPESAYSVRRGPHHLSLSLLFSPLSSLFSLRSGRLQPMAPPHK